MCREYRALRYLPLWVFGSEGVHLCKECEIKVNRFVERAAHETLRRKRDERRLHEQVFPVPQESDLDWRNNGLTTGDSLHR
jgi:hypothetical protein